MHGKKKKTKNKDYEKGWRICRNEVIKSSKWEYKGKKRNRITDIRCFCVSHYCESV